MDGLDDKHRRFRALGGSKDCMLAATGGAPSTLDVLRQPPTLVQDCVAGDLSAWRHLHREYYQIVVAFLRRLGVVESDLDDTCQEVFLQLFRSLPQFRGDSALKTWIYRLCATQASRLRRRRRLLSRFSELFQPESDIPAATSEGEDALVARAALDRAMTKLTERERLVFVLFELEGLSGAEVAAIAGCPVNTVWRRLFDARRRLKDSLEQDSK